MRTRITIGLILFLGFLFPTLVHAATVFNLEGGITLILPNEWKKIDCPTENTHSIFCAEIQSRTTNIEISTAGDPTHVGPFQGYTLFTKNGKKPGFSLVIRPRYWRLRDNSEVVSWVYEMTFESRPGHLRNETHVVFCKNKICVRIVRGEHDFETWLPLITQGIFLP